MPDQPLLLKIKRGSWVILGRCLQTERFGCPAPGCATPRWALPLPLCREASASPNGAPPTSPAGCGPCKAPHKCPLSSVLSQGHHAHGQHWGRGQRQDTPCPSRHGANPGPGEGRGQSRRGAAAEGQIPRTELGVSLISSHIEIKQVIFASLVTTRLACSIQIIQLRQIPINNAIRIVTSRLPTTNPFLHRSPFPSAATASPQHPVVLGVAPSPRLVLGPGVSLSHLAVPTLLLGRCIGLYSDRSFLLDLCRLEERF